MKLSREETEAVRKCTGLETSMSGGTQCNASLKCGQGAIMAETEPVIKSVEAAMKGLAAGTGSCVGSSCGCKAEPQDDGEKSI